MPNAFERIIDVENIEKAYRKALKGKNKYSLEAIRFSSDETHNLDVLRQSLIDGTYEFDGYTRFSVYEPKERIIDAPHFKDKIVQLAINNVLKSIYQPCFIYDSYASLDDKGTHKCAERIQKFLRKAKWQYGDSAYLIKVDVQKFFYSIDRDVLKCVLKKKIHDPQTLVLLFKIIDSAEVLDAVGLPLGNTLSQIFANIYLNELDQFCKRRLGLKYYCRYMDDVFCVVENKEKAQRVLSDIRMFLGSKLLLKVNLNKTKLFPIKQGINIVGFKTYPTHRLLRNTCKARIKRKARKLGLLLSQGKVTVEKAEQIFNSWLGHAKYGNSRNFVKHLLKRNNYLFIDHRNCLRVR